MSKKTLAESGWLDFVLDHWRIAMSAAESTLSDLSHIRTCEVAGCERMFDGSDPRAVTRDASGNGVDCCPACEIEHDPLKARAALKLALERNPQADI